MTMTCLVTCLTVAAFVAGLFAVATLTVYTLRRVVWRVRP